jgi:hypothetical protein
LDEAVGTLDPERNGRIEPELFVEPELVKMTSFDGMQIGFVYRPDAQKFPGRRPCLVSIHGGPESQSRPIFQARNNYYLNELGWPRFPNVRVRWLRNLPHARQRLKREDSVKDIGTVITGSKTPD